MDIFIQKYNIAFEYDGKHWHSKSEYNNDMIKDEKCVLKNIELFRIHENSRDYINDIKMQLVEKVNIINKYIDINEGDILSISDENIYTFVNENINDLDDIRKIISNYKYYSDFINCEKNLYDKLHKRRLLNELNVLERVRMVWTDEKIMIEIDKYEYLSDFTKNSKSCYDHIIYSKKHYLISHLKRVTFWTDESITEEVGKYNSLSDFMKNSSACYCYVKNHKKDILLAPLKRRFLWTDEIIINEISKYEYFDEFWKNSSNCYKYVKKSKKDHLMTNLKIRPATKYSLDEIIEKTLNYEYLIDFRLENPQMYQWVSAHHSTKVLSHLNKNRKPR